ncbi:MAG: hypothetical protein QM697_09275 [Lachnospiraceae bacterium]
MKKTYLLSFLLCILFLGCVYFGSYYYVTKYMTEPIIEKYDQVTADNETAEDQQGESDAAIFVDTNDVERIDSYTNYILESYDMTNYELHEEKLPMPSEYIGLTRDELIAYLEDYVRYPSEEDQEKSLEDIQLISYSDGQIIIRKSFKPEEIPETFYLMVENNVVNVYYKDKKTVYMYTDISLDTLPTDVQNEIISIKYIRSPEELYNFLETYSS